MKKVLVNHTNHLVNEWLQHQVDVTHRMFDRIVDVPFPKIDHEATIEEVSKLAKDNLKTIMKQYEPSAILLAGEFTYVYQFLKHAEKHTDVQIFYAANRGKDEHGKLIFVQYRSYRL